MKLGNQTTSASKVRRVDFSGCGPPQPPKSIGIQRPMKLIVESRTIKTDSRIHLVGAVSSPRTFASECTTYRKSPGATMVP